MVSRSFVRLWCWNRMKKVLLYRWYKTCLKYIYWLYVWRWRNWVLFVYRYVVLVTEWKHSFTPFVFWLHESPKYILSWRCNIMGTAQGQGCESTSLYCGSGLLFPLKCGSIRIQILILNSSNRGREGRSRQRGPLRGGQRGRWGLCRKFETVHTKGNWVDLKKKMKKLWKIHVLPKEKRKLNMRQAETRIFYVKYFLVHL